MVFIEVVYQVPEQLLVLFDRSELCKVHLEEPNFVQLHADFLVEILGALKLSLELFASKLGIIGGSVASAVHLFAYGDLEARLIDSLTTECAQYNNLIGFFGGFGDGFPELGS